MPRDPRRRPVYRAPTGSPYDRPQPLAHELLEFQREREPDQRQLRRRIKALREKVEVALNDGTSWNSDRFGISLDPGIP